MCGILLNLRSLPRLGSDVDGARLADNLCFDGHAVGHARVFLPKGFSVASRSSSKKLPSFGSLMVREVLV